MDWSSLGLAAAASSTSGLNLYATVLTLSLMQRFGWLQLPAEWRILGETWVMILAGILFAIEFVADKIPYVDSAWDAVHTFIRVPAGAILMASAFANVDPSTRLAAGLLGGSLALTTHSAKATARLAANTSPEPFSNSLLSVLEDTATIFLLGLAASHPLLAGLALAFVLGLCAVLLYTCFKFTRMFFAKLRRWVRANAAESTPAD
ncbi:MAG: DUF4126 domain-containing protein [Acidobacteria bacterium]|nr:DUF4126 domain-containing protein [Acidobacteriota bacterium]MCI0620215.1 DUF4126 domain-containing protein [Acidobacteriota bacterium]MCI0722855.1 DUF4126 domain-containing protein [Acidobacteriota bacterium]